jgi:octaprenyl-diphosphate synthase
VTGAISSLRQARRIKEVFDPIRPRLALVETFLQREMAEALPMVGEVGGYAIGSGGKRLRPALVLLISRLFGYTGERDIRYGGVVELIHTATLIHDDIIDGSDLRRGQATANRRWGNEPTVLVGDWLYTRAMDLCLEYGDVDIMRRLITATLQMTEGEILASQVRGRVDITEEIYMDITRRKTAELFAAACAVPALFQPSTLHYTDTLLEFGRDLGRCFQLIDDLLDFTSDRKNLGKPVMADLREGRATLPILLLLPKLDRRTRDAVAAVAQGREFSEDLTAEALLEMVRTSGVLDQTRQRAMDYADRATAHAMKLPEGPEREALITAARVLVQRTS